MKHYIFSRRNLSKSMAAVLIAVALPRLGMAQAPDVPVPVWQPAFAASTDEIVKQAKLYWNNDKDFVVFKNGTLVIVPDGFSDEKATQYAREVLAAILNFHPDMQALPMTDGNVLVQYNHPAFNIVFQDLVQRNWAEVDARHLDGLAAFEVIITPQGENIFDDLGKMALLGRAYFFMDAVSPDVVRIARKSEE